MFYFTECRHGICAKCGGKLTKKRCPVCKHKGEPLVITLILNPPEAPAAAGEDEDDKANQGSDKELDNQGSGIL